MIVLPEYPTKSGKIIFKLASDLFIEKASFW